MKLDLQHYRETSLQTWGEMAPGWEDRREWLLSFTGKINEWLVDRVDPQSGEGDELVVPAACWGVVAG